MSIVCVLKTGPLSIIADTKCSHLVFTITSKMASAPLEVRVDVAVELRHFLLEHGVPAEEAGALRLQLLLRVQGELLQLLLQNGPAAGGRRLDRTVYIRPQ